MTQFELSYLFQLGIDNLFEASTAFLGITSAIFVAVHTARNSLNLYLVFGIIIIYTTAAMTSALSMLAVSDRLTKVAADVTSVASATGATLQATEAYSADLWPYGSDYMTVIFWIILWASAVF